MWFVQFTCTNLDGCQKEGGTQKGGVPHEKEGQGEGGYNPGGKEETALVNENYNEESWIT